MHLLSQLIIQVVFRVGVELCRSNCAFKLYCKGSKYQYNEDSGVPYGWAQVLLDLGLSGTYTEDSSTYGT